MAITGWTNQPVGKGIYARSVVFTLKSNSVTGMVAVNLEGTPVFKIDKDTGDMIFTGLLIESSDEV